MPVYGRVIEFERGNESKRMLYRIVNSLSGTNAYTISVWTSPTEPTISDTPGSCQKNAGLVYPEDRMLASKATESLRSKEAGKPVKIKLQPFKGAHRPVAQQAAPKVAPAVLHKSSKN